MTGTVIWPSNIPGWSGEYFCCNFQGGGGGCGPPVGEGDGRVSATETLSAVRHHHDAHAVSTRYVSTRSNRSGSSRWENICFLYILNKFVSIVFRVRMPFLLLLLLLLVFKRLNSEQFLGLFLCSAPFLLSFHWTSVETAQSWLEVGITQKCLLCSYNVINHKKDFQRKLATKCYRYRVVSSRLWPADQSKIRSISATWLLISVDSLKASSYVILLFNRIWFVQTFIFGEILNET